MARGFRISLANKCQFLFGLAVVLILLAALAVVWLRMQTLVEQGVMKQARNIADNVLAQQRPAESAASGGKPLPSGVNLRIGAIDKARFAQFSAADPFLASAIEKFQLRPSADEHFAAATDADGNGDGYYRYVRADRERPTANGTDGVVTGWGAAPMPDALVRLLLVELRDPDTAVQQLINRIYIVAAGLTAGLLAIAAFWFITTRLILSPVRLLRDYAQKVSRGDVHIRADVNTGDEFQQLSDMFNAMLDKVKVNESELRAANKSMELKLGEVAESNVALYEANKIKGEFLANVSHELRTPLNSIVGFGEVLQESLVDRTGPVDEKRKRYIANIINSSRRLLDLINDLLDLAKIEAGRMELNLAPVSVTDTTEGLINLIRPLAEKHQIDLRLRIEPNLPTIQTDAGKLQQILFNFLSNAVKFTPIAGTVTLAAAHIPAAGTAGRGQVRFSVSDTGPGIPNEDHERIFEKFTQLDPSTTKEHGGTGLGLTISRELAELLQGRIELDSAPEAGASFSLLVPVVMERKGAPLMPEVTVG